jgi:outer membrane receptor for monomeric catechols
MAENTSSAFVINTLEGGALAGFSIGGGARYVDSVRTSYTGAAIDNQNDTVVDATLGHDLGDWAIQLNIENLFYKKYSINNHQTFFTATWPESH